MQAAYDFGADRPVIPKFYTKRRYAYLFSSKIDEPPKETSFQFHNSSKQTPAAQNRKISTMKKIINNSVKSRIDKTSTKLFYFQKNLNF